MAVLGEGPVSHERGTPVNGMAPTRGGGAGPKTAGKFFLLLLNADLSQKLRGQQMPSPRPWKNPS